MHLSGSWGGVILLLLIYSFWFNIFPARAAVSPGFNNGASLIWFVEVYLIGRYLRLYGIPQWFRKMSFLIVLFQILSISVLAYLAFRFVPEAKLPKAIGLIGAQNNPIVLAGAIATFCSFQKFNINSKFVNHIAKSTLSVLIIHASIIWVYMQDVYTHLFNYKFGIELIVWWIITALIIYVLSVLIDQIRLLIYNRIKVSSLVKKYE